MSICYSGINEKLTTKKIRIEVSEDHPLIKLANSLRWDDLVEKVIEDLKNTAAGKFWTGRKLKLRTHLGVYLLQQIFNATDRGIEEQIKYNPVFQMFCGKTIVNNWHCPDHTRIHEFRCRLTPATQCHLANAIATRAVKLGFANPAHIDIDSTVQEANIQPPSISNLLIKAAGNSRRIQKLLIEKKLIAENALIPIDMKEVKAKARAYYFIKRKKSLKYARRKDQALKELWSFVAPNVQAVLAYCHLLTEPFIFASLDKRKQILVSQFVNKTATFISEAHGHIFLQIPMNCKIYSFHLDEVDCFNKQKENKNYEIGRQFQICRIEGNFVFSIPNHSIRMPDAECFPLIIQGHINEFQVPIESSTADKAFYSKKNEQCAIDLGIKNVALQRPHRKLRDPPNNPITEERLTELINRRAGIEPIIGHLKRRWQLGRSRMKSDKTTEASGFAAMLGFNLYQLMRNLSGAVKPKAA